MTASVLLAFYTFVLACVAGYQLITKVPPTLHTPLMSGANAISGITILGAISVAQVAALRDTNLAAIIGMLAVAFATINVVGGFMVTDRMLQKFGPRPKARKTEASDV
jgi:H+-translocating NAD(P) transhydrogenase subunit alpha